jgi:hypothetical protein
MVLLGGGQPNWRYYMCRKAYNGVGCSDQWVRYPGIEDLLTIDIEEIIKSCPKPALTSVARSHMLAQIRIRLHILRRRKASMAAEHKQLRQSLRPVLEAEKSVDAETVKLLADRKRLRIDRPKWLDVTLAARVEKLRQVAKASVLDRKALHATLLSLFVKVVVDWERQQLIFHWKHGGQSAVKAVMKPLRDVENKRRSARPRYRPGEVAPTLPVVAR